MEAVKEERRPRCLLVCRECSPSCVLTGTMSVSGSDVGTRTSANARTPSASESSNADGSIPSYLYDLDDEEAAELFGACTPQDTDEEGSVESAGQSNRARASIPLKGHNAPSLSRITLIPLFFEFLDPKIGGEGPWSPPNPGP